MPRRIAFGAGMELGDLLGEFAVDNTPARISRMRRSARILPVRSSCRSASALFCAAALVAAASSMALRSANQQHQPVAAKTAAALMHTCGPIPIEPIVATHRKMKAPGTACCAAVPTTAVGPSGCHDLYSLSFESRLEYSRKQEICFRFPDLMHARMKTQKIPE